MRSIAAAIGVLGVIALGVWAAMASEPEHEIGSYVTSLEGRTESQRFNADLALRKINGTVIRPGATFSFLKTVGPWTADMGYEKAPVSYDGELVASWGGGVCQTSTTLYNAALLAGLEVIERHRHHWPARYAPVGRDAAVAYYDIDLKFRNNLPAPVRVVGEIKGKKMVFRMMSTHRPACSVRIESDTRSVIKQSEVIQQGEAEGSRRLKVINRGHPGFQVATYRTFISPNDTRRELVSDDRYPAMNRVVRIDAGGSDQ
jgi:vancomycin resistance protein VanW